VSRETYLVRVKRPAGISVTQMAAHIRTAVNGWAGGYHPDDPLTRLPAVTVRRQPKDYPEWTRGFGYALAQINRIYAKAGEPIKTLLAEAGLSIVDLEKAVEVYDLDEIKKALKRG
jgi:hypothetical protein